MLVYVRLLIILLSDTDVGFVLEPDLEVDQWLNTQVVDDTNKENLLGK